MAESANSSILRRGYLNVIKNPKRGMVGSITTSFSSRKYWVILRKDTSGSCLLEQHRNEEAMMQGNPIKSIFLSSSISLSVTETKKAFTVANGEESTMFLCSSFADMEDWVRDIRRYADIPVPASQNSHSNGLSSSMGTEMYEVISNDEAFEVDLRQSNTVVYHGPCSLEILKDFERNVYDLALYTLQHPSRLIVKWQIDHIRQYGSNNLAFKFQSGRKSSTGVDWFILDTKPGDATRIHRAVEHWARHIVQETRNRGQSLSSGESRRRVQSSVQAKHPLVRAQASSLPSSSTHYAPLSEETKQPETHYESVNQRQSVRSSTLSSTPQSPYQVLNSPSHLPDNTYQELDGRSREDPPTVPPRMPLANGSKKSDGVSMSPPQNYMDLKQNKKSDGDGKQSGGIYMDLDK